MLGIDGWVHSKASYTVLPLACNPAGIQPAELRHSGATLSLARRGMDSWHLFHSALTCPSGGNALRLKSKSHFALPHKNSSVYSTTTTYVRHSGRITDGVRNASRALRDSVLPSPIPTPRTALPRALWIRPNRLRTGVGCFRSSLTLAQMGMPRRVDREGGIRAIPPPIPKRCTNIFKVS